MQTQLSSTFKNTAQGMEADSILRACTHCGFCTATCPTYQLLGDELDGPRGRIYLIKEMLEGETVTQKTQLHLDRCLTCRACETTCPSGVQYGKLLDIGRAIVEKNVPRPWSQRLVQSLLRAIIPHPARFTPLLRLGQMMRPLLPAALKKSVPPKQSPGIWPAARHARRMLVLDGCVQPAISPNINAAAARVLDRLSISLIRIQEAGCCGAVSYHLNAHAEGLDFMRRNIDAWWPHIEQGAEAIVTTASGCGVLVKDYAHILRHDPQYAQKATRISALTLDISQVLLAEKNNLAALVKAPPATNQAGQKLAVHSPCTLQHEQKLPGSVERVLQSCGFELAFVPDAHLCCGSAGTYSILQKTLSQRLLRNKLAALQSGAPTGIATANIGCLTHLQTAASVPVRHWIEWLDEIQ
ncbi:MAG: glycolate oxidase subunit GlcF [Candidatus Nitrotoga sp.]